MNDLLLAVDVLNDFAHEDGDRLLTSFRTRADGFVGALAHARRVGLPVCWPTRPTAHGMATPGRLFGARWQGLPATSVERLGPPVPGEASLVKPRYSAFDLTPLELVLEQKEVERILLIGMAPEMCVAQTAIDARERGFKVTVVTDACASVTDELESIALEYLVGVTGCRLAASIDVGRDG